MERRIIACPVPPAYPAHARITPLGARRLALVAALGAAPLTACQQTGARVDGTGIEPDEEPWDVTLPSEGSHPVGLTDGAELTYHLELTIYRPIRACLEEREDAVLINIDEVLAVEPGATFTGGSDLARMESAAAEALIEFCGVEPSTVEQSNLVVDQLTWPEE